MPPQPVPEPDLESQAYWNGLKEHRIDLQKCSDCTRVRFPAMVTCPYCGSRAFETVSVSGNGTVYSWVVVHRPFHPAFADAIPYVIASVDLDEGPRMVGRLEGGEPRCDLPVTAKYVDHEGWTEVRFDIDESIELAPASNGGRT